MIHPRRANSSICEFTDVFQKIEKITHAKQRNLQCICIFMCIHELYSYIFMNCTHTYSMNCIRAYSYELYSYIFNEPYLCIFMNFTHTYSCTVFVSIHEMNYCIFNTISRILNCCCFSYSYWFTFDAQPCLIHIHVNRKLVFVCPCMNSSRNTH